MQDQAGELPPSFYFHALVDYAHFVSFSIQLSSELQRNFTVLFCFISCGNSSRFLVWWIVPRQGRRETQEERESALCGMCVLSRGTDLQRQKKQRDEEKSKARPDVNRAASGLGEGRGLRHNQQQQWRFTRDGSRQGMSQHSTAQPHKPSTAAPDVFVTTIEMEGDNDEEEKKLNWGLARLVLAASLSVRPHAGTGGRTCN